MIGGFRNRLIAGGNILNGTIDYQEYQNLRGAVKGPLLTDVAMEIGEPFGLCRKQFLHPAELSLSLPARSSFMRCATSKIASSPTATSPAAAPGDILSPKVARSGMSIPPGRCSAISRAAPRCRASTRTPSRRRRCSNVDAQTATTYEIGTRGRRPDFTWDLSLYRAEISNELQCLTDVAVSLLHRRRTRTAPFIRASRPGFGVAFLKSVFAQEDRVWFNVAYTYNDFFFDGDARCGNNRLPGAPPHYIRAEVLYKHPSGFYAGPNVEWMPQSLLRRQRQQPHDRTLCAAELQGRLRHGATAGPAISKRATCSTPATSRAPSSPRSPPPHRRCSIPASAARSIGGLRYRM